MNNEMLQNIDYLRERANVSYEEAERLLDQYDGNIMSALIELEKQGRTYGQTPPDDGHEWTSPADGDPAREQSPESSPIDEGMKKVTTFIENAMNTHLVVEQKTDDKKKKVLEVPLPLAVVATLAAPWLTVAAAGLGFATGHNAKIVKEKDAEKPGDTNRDS